MLESFQLPFSALTMLVGWWQEGHPACEKSRTSATTIPSCL